MVPIWMSPEGIRKFESLTDRTTSSTEIAFAYRRSRFRLTAICRILPPSTLAAATPLIRSIWGSIVL